MNYRKGISDNFSRTFGYRVLVVESWNCEPGNFEIHISQQSAEGKTLFAQPVELVFKERPDTGYGPPKEPFLNFNSGDDFDRMGGSLMQALERAFLPVGQQKPEAIKAMNNHLQDMRALVFNTDKPS